MIMRSDGRLFPGPRRDYNLKGRRLLAKSNGRWRLGDVDGNHFSLQHKSGRTAMIWRSDGTQHPGPRSDWGTWKKPRTCGKAKAGLDFVQLGRWRVGNVDGAHMSVYQTRTFKTAVIYRSDGTV